jgi:hypothetical protein
MKRIALLLILMISAGGFLAAQNTLIGKWRPVRIKSPEMGEFPVLEEPLRKFAYEKTLEEKKGQPLDAADSADVEALVAQMQQQFGNMVMEFRTNKTYSGTLEGKTVTGRYVYNAPKKTLTTYPPKKPAKTARVGFENGLLRLENIGQKVVVFLERMPG